MSWPFDGAPRRIEGERIYAPRHTMQILDPDWDLDVIEWNLGLSEKLWKGKTDEEPEGVTLHLVEGDPV